MEEEIGVLKEIFCSEQDNLEIERFRTGKYEVAIRITLKFNIRVSYALNASYPEIQPDLFCDNWSFSERTFGNLIKFINF